MSQQANMPGNACCPPALSMVIGKNNLKAGTKQHLNMHWQGRDFQGWRLTISLACAECFTECMHAPQESKVHSRAQRIGKQAPQCNPEAAFFPGTTSSSIVHQFMSIAQHKIQRKQKAKKIGQTWLRKRTTGSTSAAVEHKHKDEERKTKEDK
jgi:hypothetical protein